MESSDKTCSTAEGNGKPLQHSCLENPMIKHWKMNSPGWKVPRYATGEEWRNSSRRSEEAESKWKQCPVVDVSGGESKVWCCKEQYCIETWHVRSVNQGKLEVVKQEMARVNIDVLGISELKWMGMGKFNSDDLYIYYYGQESLRRNGVALIVNKRFQNAVLGCNLKTTEWSLFTSKANHSVITVIQLYAPTTNAREAEVERFYKDLQDFLELTPKKNTQKDVLFIKGTGIQK